MLKEELSSECGLVMNPMLVQDTTKHVWQCSQVGNGQIRRAVSHTHSSATTKVMKNNTSSFIYVNVSETWKNAQSYCRVKHTDLASVRNQSENEQLKMMLNNSPTWIGLYRNAWMWSDGSAYSFPNWAPNKPLSEDNYSCGTTYLEKWHNSACNGYNYFLCYTDVKDQRLLKVELKTTDASVDMEVLQNDILEKFNQRLMENGLSEFTLRWVKQLDGNIFHKKEQEEEKEETEEEICAVTLTL
uniref:Macrophage mannose receptor 1-like n=1 Tax=Haplochromis burtoni TaxID=8153 RepID=A0A3Q3BXD4_HAPBU